MSTPFIFSSLALDVRRSGVVRLVNAFLATCTDGNGNGMGRTGGHDKFVEEARFAGAHELGMALRWGLSRVEGGREVRGLLSWAWYERWRAEESALAESLLYLRVYFLAFASLHLGVFRPRLSTPLFRAESCCCYYFCFAVFGLRRLCMCIFGLVRRFCACLFADCGEVFC
ncbi:hypothetical protein K438DRAFT_1796058 [Mycena galopus ATCC 62051]|nr:hypothetical protein K438DRAFT_1796058 [Mycena galopus ATCC 62051]